jgi:hypothetical protein
MSFLRHGESINPMVGSTGSKRSGSLPVPIGFDEFQPAIPRQVALQQSLPPLRRPRTILQNPTPPYNDFSANGDKPLNSVSQPKGALHITSPPKLPHPPGALIGSLLTSRMWVARGVERRAVSVGCAGARCDASVQFRNAAQSTRGKGAGDFAEEGGFLVVRFDQREGDFGGPEFDGDAWESGAGTDVGEGGGRVKVRIFNHRGHGGRAGEEVAGGEEAFAEVAGDDLFGIADGGEVDAGVPAEE